MTRNKELQEKVFIPVDKSTRKILKKEKGTSTYNAFILKMMEDIEGMQDLIESLRKRKFTVLQLQAYIKNLENNNKRLREECI